MNKAWNGGNGKSSVELVELEDCPGIYCPDPWQLIFCQIPPSPNRCRCMSCTGREALPDGELPFGKSDVADNDDRFHPELPVEWHRKPRLIILDESGVKHLVCAANYLSRLYRISGTQPPVPIGFCACPACRQAES